MKQAISCNNYFLYLTFNHLVVRLSKHICISALSDKCWKVLKRWNNFVGCLMKQSLDFIIWYKLMRAATCIRFQCLLALAHPSCPYPKILFHCAAISLFYTRFVSLRFDGCTEHIFTACSYEKVTILSNVTFCKVLCSGSSICHDHVTYNKH